MAESNFSQSSSSGILWIGNRQIPEFRPVFDYCLTHARHVATRPTFADALRSPLDNVGGVIVACENRAPVDRSAVVDLVSRYGEAEFIQLLGPLAVGDRQNDLRFRRVFWNQWREPLEQLLLSGAIAESRTSKAPAKAVAVVAQTHALAEPLIDLVTASSAAAIWCRRADTVRARNFDVVWWDDSVAAPASEHQWRCRMEGMDRHCFVRPKHVWLANMPHAGQIQAATAAGVDVVISKPIRIESLLATLGVHQQSQCPSEVVSARAA